MSRGDRSVTRDARDLPSALDSWDRIASRLAGRRPVLFLDYDGTLTPIVSQPEDAVLSEEMRATLRRLAELCTVAIVSGRDRGDVEPLVGLEQLVYAGSHGFDIKGPDGLRMEHEGGREALPALEEAEAALVERLADVDGARVERKRFAIAIHYRNVAEADVSRVADAVDELARRHETLRISGGKKVFELRPDLDWDKGRAVLWLMDALNLNEGEVEPFYIGDDVTDEDAFRAIADRGVGIVVGVPPHATAAHYALRDTDAVRRFLQRMIERLGG